MSSNPVVLFLCTGNYYRSRTAEALFSHYARARGAKFDAASRGLRLNAGNKGPISRFAVAWLEHHKVPFDGERRPLDAAEEDFRRARHVVAIDEDEHRPMMRDRFPSWEGRIEYWKVHDIDLTSPALALGALDRLVQDLLKRLMAEGADGTGERESVDQAEGAGAG